MITFTSDAARRAFRNMIIIFFAIANLIANLWPFLIAAK